MDHWKCGGRCDKSFPCQRDLSLHRYNNPDCKERFEGFLESLQFDPPLMTHLSETSILPDDDTETVLSEDVPSSEDYYAIETGEPFASHQDASGGPAIVPSDELTEFEDIFPGAGTVWRTEAPTFAHQRLALLAQQLPYDHPFPKEDDRSLAAWLHESGISRAKMDQFFQLTYVKRNPPTFSNSAAVVKNLGNIPYPGPKWKASKITPAYGTASTMPILFHRDPLEVIRHLFSRPCLADDMEFAPKKVYADEERTSPLYSEMSSGEWWWRTQAALPEGATVVPVIIASDSTHLTRFSGGKKAWPVYLSIGNIKSTARNLPSKGAWMLIGYIPAVDFVDHHSITGTLAARFYHQCMETILNPLIEPATHGTDICDSKGDTRFCFTPLAAHIGDLPEQQLSNIAPSNSSPTTTAIHDGLGDEKTHPPRTREWIMAAIESACQAASPDNIKGYQKAAKRRGITGVHLPFWRNMPHYQPEFGVCPDILHGIFKFWRDHILLWSRRLVGTDEYDARLKSLQSVPKYRHFKSGIKHLSQYTGREDRELLRTHVALIAGHEKIHRLVLQNQRAIADFIYLVQYKSHSPTTLQYMADALASFHRTKHIYITLGVRRGARGIMDHFRIPKLSVLGTFANHITQLGSSPQYSTEISETLHRTFAKDLYNFTNHKNYVFQMCTRLDRSERIAYQKEFIRWCEEQDEEARLQKSFQVYSPRYRKIIIARHKQMVEESNLDRPHDRRIVVKTRIQGSRLWLALKPHMPKQRVAAIAERYGLHDLEDLVESFLYSINDYAEVDDIKVTSIDVWTKLRLRVGDVQEEDGVSQEHCIEALPPSPTLPFGRCHCALVHNDEQAQETGIEGYHVAQVRLLFRVHLANTRNPLHHKELAYVQYFSKPRREPEKGVHMFVVSRQDLVGRRKGAIIPIESISRFVQLIPKFGKKAHVSFTADNSMDIGRDYYVNSFADKQIFQSVW